MKSSKSYYILLFLSEPPIITLITRLIFLLNFSHIKHKHFYALYSWTECSRLIYFLAFIAVPAIRLKT